MLPFQRTFCIFVPCGNAGHTALQPTSSLPQAGVQLAPAAVRNSIFWLSSEPLRYPRLRQAADTLGVSGRQRSGQRLECK